MSTRSIDLVQGEFYHIYNRGTEKRTLYETHADYQRFIDLLFLSNSKKEINVRNIRRRYNSIFEFERGEQFVSIGAYCLMPNHFHILATPLVEDGLSAFMGKLSTSYSMYFNKKYERTGNLFQGTYKSKHAYTDEYLKYLFSYIHLNPVKLIQSDWKEKGIRNQHEALGYLAKYPYSSYQEYLDIPSRDGISENEKSRKEKAILNTDAFPNYFETPDSFKREIFQWIQYDPD